MRRVAYRSCGRSARNSKANGPASTVFKSSYREFVHDLAPLLDASRGSAIETPWGSLLGDYMTAVERWLPSMEASDMPRLAQRCAT